MSDTTTIDVLSEHCKGQREKIRHLEKLLAVCVARLGGRVLITADDDDYYVRLDQSSPAPDVWELKTV